MQIQQMISVSSRWMSRGYVQKRKIVRNAIANSTYIRDTRASSLCWSC